MDATWHLGPRGSATRRLRGVYIFINILHIIYSRGFQLSVDRKGIQTIRSSGVINPIVLLNFFPCGTKSHTVIFISSDVADGGASIVRSAENPCVDRVNAGPLINQ